MTVIKRTKADSSNDLIRSIEKFVDLLQSQDEQEAIDALNEAAARIEQASSGSQQHRDAVKYLLEVFEDQELMAYTHQREDDQSWTEASALSQASSRVVSLAKRILA